MFQVGDLVEKFTGDYRPPGEVRTGVHGLGRRPGAIRSSAQGRGWRPLLPHLQRGQFAQSSSSARGGRRPAASCVRGTTMTVLLLTLMVLIVAFAEVGWLCRG